MVDFRTENGVGGPDGVMRKLEISEADMFAKGQRILWEDPMSLLNPADFLTWCLLFTLGTP